MGRRRLYFPSKDLPWLEEKLNEALEESASGTVMTSWGEGDTNAAHQLLHHVDERIRRLSHDLSILDPARYPVEEVTPITRTRPNFSNVSL